MNRKSSLTATFTSLFALITVVVPVCSQGLNWSVLSSTADPSGNTIVVEQASTGLKRETKISFYPGTTKIWTQTVSEINPNGSRIVTHKAWTESGTQKEYYTRTHNEVGVVESGERWFIDPSGRRFFEKWDTTRGGWMPAGSDAGPPVNTARRLVRVRYAASRNADAQRAAQMLTQKGFAPSLMSIPEGEGQVFIRGLQFYRDTDADNARDIAQTLRDIEPLTPHFLGPKSKDDYEPTDHHFQVSLFAKKKPLVRIGFTEDRRFDAESCETALKLRGFYVDLEVVQEANVENRVKGLIFYHRPNDKTVADSIPACLANSNDKLTSTLRRTSAGPNPPDFQFVLTKKEIKSRNFSYTTQATPSAPNEDAAINKRLKDVQETWLQRLAPGTGVANIIGRNAEDKIWDVQYRLEIKEIASGRVVRCGGSWENCVLPQGTYRVTNYMNGYGSSGRLAIVPVEFSVRAGGITMVEVGGRQNVGRVIYESRDLNGAVTDYWITISSKDHPSKWWAVLGKTDAASPFKMVDVPPGVYYATVRYGTYLNVQIEAFTVKAGETTIIRSINRGRLAVRRGDGPSGTNVSVDKVAYLSYDNNDFVDVPAGEYRVYVAGVWKQVTVRPGETVFLKR